LGREVNPVVPGQNMTHRPNLRVLESLQTGRTRMRIVRAPDAYHHVLHEPHQVALRHFKRRHHVSVEDMKKALCGSLSIGAKRGIRASICELRKPPPNKLFRGWATYGVPDANSDVLQRERLASAFVQNINHSLELEFTSCIRVDDCAGTPGADRNSVFITSIVLRQN